MLTSLFRRIIKGKKPAVLSHWYCLLPSFKCGTDAFYEAVEKEIEAQNIPGIAVSRHEHYEGSLLSARREYLCLKRERLVFEVCSAPFGTSWFFSCRFSQYPLSLRLWHFVFVLLCGGLLWFGYYYVFGYFWGTILFLSLIPILAIILKLLEVENKIALDLKILDMPIIGGIYEILFRRDSYYRQDTRLMYTDAVDAIVKSQIQMVAGKADISNVEFKQDESFTGLSFTGLFQKGLQLWSRLLKG